MNIFRVFQQWSSGQCIRVSGGGTADEERLVECPLELLCALGIHCKITTVEELVGLVSNPISSADLTDAREIVHLFSPPTPASPPKGSGSVDVDLGRIFRDGKYSLQIQDWIGGRSGFASTLLCALQGSVLALSLNALGCRVVQKLVDVCEPEDVESVILPELAGHVLECSMDVNGNHVIQKCVDRLPARGVIVEAIIAGDGSKRERVMKLASHCYGCRVVQRLMSRCDMSVVHGLFEAISSDPTLIAALTEDVFGNYVMQHVLEYGRSVDRERAILCLASMDVIMLGCSKFASNVVEKAFRTVTNRSLSANEVMVVRLLINATLTCVDSRSGELGILTLMKDRYGNYVVRAVIELARPEFASEVMLVRRLVTENASQLKKFTFSWHLVERLDKLEMRKHGF